MICPKCNTQNLDQAQFCANYGTSLAVSQAVEPLVVASHQSKLKILIVIFIILFVVILSSIVISQFLNRKQPKISVSPLPTNQNSANPAIKTNNWKTYTDPNFGYSLQYPSSWQIKTIEKPGNIRIFNPDKYDESVKFSFEAIEIDPYNQYSMEIPIPTWIEKQQEEFKKHAGEPQGGGTPFNLIKEITVDNQPAYKTSTSNILGTQIIYLIPNKQTVYSLILYKENNKTDNFDEGTDELAKIYQTMLSSFKLSSTTSTPFSTSSFNKVSVKEKKLYVADSTGANEIYVSEIEPNDASLTENSYIYSLSPDNTKLAFIRFFGDRPVDPIIYTPHLFIYNIKEKTLRDIFNFSNDKNINRVDKITWNNDGNSATLEYGNVDMVGAKITIDINTGKEIK